MTKTISCLLLIATVGAGAFIAGCSQGHDNGPGAANQDAKTLYTCGMHPQVIQDHPGNCPICGMKLNPIRKQAAATPAAPAGGPRKILYYKSTMMPGEVRQAPGKDSMGMDMVPVYEDPATAAGSSAISIDPVTIQNMGLRTGEVTRGPLRRVIRTVAVIAYNETALADVTTKFKGWIEKLHVDSTGRQVHKGDPLFDIYSPDLYSAEVEYLLSLDSGTNRADAGADAVNTSAQLKLKFFDISDEQIAGLAKTRQPSKTLRIHAPMDGFVVEKMVVEGQMVDAGMKLYRLADLGLVWVQAQVYEEDLPYLKLGQEATVTLTYLPDRKFRGRITYIYPSVDEKTRTAQVRMEFHNPGFFLKPGMFATAEVRAELAPSALLVPDMAVLRSGERNTVFVRLPGGKFDPRVVTLGPRSEDNRYQVLSGLNEGEPVVTSGQFLLDSESQLREAIQKMREPGHATAAPPPVGEPPTNAPPPSITEKSPPERMVYICPMPEHVSIEYAHPGKCPVCGMTLVPVTKSALEKIQPGGQLLYYTCPMPEHVDVRSTTPGKCPKCGMTLIPVMLPPANNPTPVTAPSNTPTAPKLYTCPMAEHADVVADQPGTCPKCGMKLVPTSTVSHGKEAEKRWREEKAHAREH
ncbi:MAG: efflux RND transporter periplasmic adaptor subunit [Limisphaerales bacterium]